MTKTEIVETDDALELETGAIIAGPDHIGFDPADDRQANDNAVAAIQLVRIVDHETMGRDVAYMEVEIAMGEMLDDHREIDRVTRRTTQVGYTEICSS